MAFPNVPFTEEGRVKTGKVLGIIHWISIVPAVFCLVTALYIQFVISDQIYFIENYNGHVLPGFLVFTGLFSLTGHILCGKVFWANHKILKREKWAKFLLPAVVVTVFIFLVQFIAGIVCIVHVGELQDSLASGILTAMKSYKNDLTTKEEMDTLQIEYECCGSKAYQDWFHVAWIHPDYLSNAAKHQKRVTNDDVPFSCCSSHVLRPCIYHHVHDNVRHYNYDYRVETTLHKKGCAQKLMDFYQNALLSNGGAVILGLSFIQLIVAAVGRIFQTALVSSQESDGDGGVSIGYLFGGGMVQSGGIVSEKSAELDTTTGTVDTENIDVSWGTDFDDTVDEPSVEEPGYLPMGGTEPTYENTRPDQSEEPIYHDGEVEHYLHDKFNRSKHYFETWSPGDPPMPSGSEDYEEPLPYPGDELETSATRHIESKSRFPSKSTLKKQSSTYVGFDPDPGAKAASNLHVAYSNVIPPAPPPPPLPPPPPPLPIPGNWESHNNSSIADDNISRNHSMSMKIGDYCYVVPTRIVRSPVPLKKKSKETDSGRSKSEYYRRSSNERPSRRVNSLPKATSEGVYGSFLQRSALNQVLGKTGKHVSRKTLTKSRTKNTKDDRPRRSATEPLLSKKTRTLDSDKNKDDVNKRFSIKQQVQSYFKAPSTLHQRVKRVDQKAVNANIVTQERHRILLQDTNKNHRNQSSQSILERSDIQTMRVQPERFETNYTPNVNVGNVQGPEYSSTNVRTSNLPFPDVRPQYRTVYQARPPVTATNSFESKTDFKELETHNRKRKATYDDGISRKYSFTCNEEYIRTRKPPNGVFYPGDYDDPMRQEDDTGIYIDSFAESLNGLGNRSSNSVNGYIATTPANKSSNSVSVELPRSQSLSPIYPVKSQEPLSPRKQTEDESDDETVVINLVSGSASDTSTLKNETH